MLNNQNIILLFSDFHKILSCNWLLLMRKSFNHEVILIFCQIPVVLRNSFDPDPDSRSFWIRIEIFGWIRIRIQWLCFWNTAYFCGNPISWHSIMRLVCHYIEGESRGVGPRPKIITWFAVHRNSNIWNNLTRLRFGWMRALWTGP